MAGMKDVFLSQLRDRETGMASFRRAAEQLSRLLVDEIVRELTFKEVSIETPMGKAMGRTLAHRIVLVPILRSGLAMLPAFMTILEDAPVGILGFKRDEITAVANCYYQNLPPMESEDRVIILDPMLATGGTAIQAVELLVNAGVPEEYISFAGIVGAPDGRDALLKAFPSMRVQVLAMDERLNDQKFIVPGLGDFGDRFYGTIC